MKKLTNKQKKVLDYFEWHKKTFDYYPATRTTQDHFGFRSQNTVMNYMNALEAKGYIERYGAGRRAGQFKVIHHEPVKA